jgi:hypothetical protein
VGLPNQHSVARHNKRLGNDWVLIMAHEKLTAVAIEVVAEYIGIAAEFVVEDAIVEVEKNPAFAQDPKLYEMYFFVCLGKLLPPEAPYGKVKEAILKALQIKP